MSDKINRKDIQFSVATTKVPEIIRLVSNQRLVDEGSFTFANVDEAKISPPIQKLFYLPFVKKVLLATNYIAIEKFDIVEWGDVTGELIEHLVESIVLNPEIIEPAQKTSATNHRKIEIYIESTPNPLALKYVGNISFTENSKEFLRSDENPNLIKDIFEKFEEVKEVFVNLNYFSFAFEDEEKMELIKNDLRHWLIEKINSQNQFLEDLDTGAISDEPKIEKDFSPIEKQIIEILDDEIKPAVQSDGGDIELISYDEGKVMISFSGACSGCPSSTFTLKQGVERILMENLGEDKIKEVVAV